MIQSKPEKSRGSFLWVFLWEGAGGDFFFKRNLLPPCLLLVPLKNKCACNIFEDEQTHCIRGTTSIGACAPTSILITGEPRPALYAYAFRQVAQQRPSSCHRADLPPSSARFPGQQTKILLHHSPICNSKIVYSREAILSRKKATFRREHRLKI